MKMRAEAQTAIGGIEETGRITGHEARIEPFANDRVGGGSRKVSS
jgi:hypothetical protein